jgi:hypothetical protein
MLANRPASVAEASLRRSTGDALPKRQRAKRTNDPFAGLDMNTARGRRTADLVWAYLTALGNPDSIERQAAAIAAAELQVLAEEARAAALKEGATADLDRVVRMQGAADRALRRLGIKPAAAAMPPPSLAAWAKQAAPVPQGAPEAGEVPSDVRTPQRGPRDDGEESGATPQEAEPDHREGS